MPHQMTTRSRSRANHLIDTTSAPLKIDVLTTPGVITSIVKNLDYDDEAIVGLFRLINDQRYRFELEPFCQHFKQVYEEHELMKEEMEKFKANKKKRIAEMIRKIKEHFQIHELATDFGYEYERLTFISTFETLCSFGYDIYWLSSEFGRKVGEKLDEYIYTSYEEYGDFEFHEQLVSLRQRLNAYIHDSKLNDYIDEMMNEL